MRVQIILAMACGFAAVLIGCGSADDAGKESAQASSQLAPQTTQPARADEPRGTITVGASSWRIVPAIQCSIFPGNMINIAGYAADDPNLEIVIDYNGPTGVRIGGEADSAVTWHAQQHTIAIQIDGKRVQGTASFNTDMSGAGASAEGSFEVDCS